MSHGSCYHGSGVVLVYMGISFSSSMCQVISIIIMMIIIQWTDFLCIGVIYFTAAWFPVQRPDFFYSSYSGLILFTGN